MHIYERISQDAQRIRLRLKAEGYAVRKRHRRPVWEITKGNCTYLLSFSVAINWWVLSPETQIHYDSIMAIINKLRGSGRCQKSN